MIEVPRCYQLVGVPAAGKSTWIKNQVWMLGLTVVNTDTFVEDYARSQGQTYSEVFNDYMPKAIDLMIEQVEFARTHNHTIIWDQTSTTVKSRARKFNMLPDYRHIAVVFPHPEPMELARRLATRPGKIIPPQVMERMIAEWQEPSFEEGFNQIWRLDEPTNRTTGW